MAPRNLESMSLSSKVRQCFRPHFLGPDFLGSQIILISSPKNGPHLRGFPRLQSLGDAEVTFKDEADEVIKLPASKLPELPKVSQSCGCGMYTSGFNEE